MADQPEPEWELLPADPWGFFGIDRDAETIDLKRSYNRFIRRYKPEKHPQEFQRIRAAYEHVHNLIRYRDNRSGPTIQFDWASAFEASIQSDSTAKAESDSKISSPSPMPTIADRIESEPIPKLLAELTAKAAKSPRDYFQLAILDGILPQSDENFENWLLEGIGNYPREIGISGLFREYLENHLSTDRLSEVLHKSRKALPADRFFQLTEPAWDRLIRECSFDEFRTTLDHCEQKLSISSSYSTLIFYLRILKPAIWKADREWIDRVTAELEDHYFQLSAWGQQEFEVLCQISQYHQGATATNQNGLLRHMNEAMQHWCLDLDGDSDRTIVECQQHIASNGRLLLDEFPGRTLSTSWRARQDARVEVLHMHLAHG